MNGKRKRLTWTIGGYVVPVILALGGLASGVDAQTVASTTSGASTLQGAEPNNAKLQSRVAAALRAQPYFDDRHIDVSVHGGAVVLSGIVFSDWDLRGALRTARNAAGGRPVVDSLSIEEGGR